MNEDVINIAETWLSEAYDKTTRDEVSQLLENDLKQLYDAFYKKLEFGTGGLRGIMGAGTNRMNIYTVAIATQGLANYLKKYYKNKEIRIAVAFDSRNNSSKFAKKTAEVLSSNGIKVFLFDDIRPTPELSFAVRHLNCHSGIVITASHNPPEYNGYKVYWEDGSQIVEPHDKGILEEINKIGSIKDVKSGEPGGRIKHIGIETDNEFLSCVKDLIGEKKNSLLNIVYTPLHGTGIKLLPKAFKMNGFNHVQIVEEQSQPDGNFPTVDYPNPEEPNALQLAINRAVKSKADLVIGTDPDADRVGSAYRNPDGGMTLLNGNQAVALQTYYLLEKEISSGRSLKDSYVATTIVTTELVDSIAKHYGVDCFRTLTGFKNIAEIIRQKGNRRFIGGGEESCGFMAGDYVRDKDAVTSAMILAKCADKAKEEYGGIYELLLHIYKRFGFYYDRLVSLTKKGAEGKIIIQNMMDGYRYNSPERIGGIEVVECIDYLQNDTGLPTSNVIQFRLADNTQITARPSGTEPKIKFYFSLKETLRSKEEYLTLLKKLEVKTDGYIKALDL